MSVRRFARSSGPLLLLLAALGSGVAAHPLDAQEGGAPEWVLEPLDWRMVGPFRGGRSTAVTGVPDPHQTFID